MRARPRATSPSPRRTRAAALVGSALVVVAATSATVACAEADRDPAPATAPANATAPEATTFTRGATGIGDPYFPRDGNGGYDVRHYGLELAYDPATDVLEGVATIDLRTTENLSRFNLDFDGLTVRSITVDGSPATFTRGRGELRVTPATALPVGHDAAVVVTYDGVPQALPPADGGWIETDDGVMVLGQPHVAATWFPANDHPRDPATFDIAMTVPSGLEAVANGALVSHDTSDGHTRWVWHADDPMAPYLATVDVGEFTIDEYHVDGARPGGVDMVDAVDDDLLGPAGAAVRASLARQPEILAFLAGRFGEYPFTDGGAIVDDATDIGFALENQTRPVYPAGFLPSAEEGEATVVHELAHQWYGDRVALPAWRHIWLNEGFATYAEWLWSEHEGGRRAQRRFDLLCQLPADHPFWQVEIGDPGPADLFAGAVYVRGAMALHALRVTVGDADFFEILRRWAVVPPTQRATTRNFVALAEQVSGQQLDGLFHEWLHATHRPALSPALAEATAGPSDDPTGDQGSTGR